MRACTSRLARSFVDTSTLVRSLFSSPKIFPIIFGESKPRNIRSSLAIEISMTLDSGNLIAECDEGSDISTSSGGRNWVVSIKNVSSRNASSTIGVMSTRTDILAFLIFGIREPFRSYLFFGRKRLDDVVARFIDHIGEVIHLVHEKVIGNDTDNSRKKAERSVDER